MPSTLASMDERMELGGVHWVVTDHLGSTRGLVGADGELKKAFDYLPFGEDLPAPVAGRSTPPYPGSVQTQALERARFTGKERDAETGLDYFGARYMSAAQGRFTSVDPGNAAAVPAEPQSWNGYSYVANNPSLFTDPSGMDYHVCDANGSNCRNLTNSQYDDYLTSLGGTSVFVTPGGQIKHQNNDGSITTIGSATYFDEKAAARANAAVSFLNFFIHDRVSTLIGAFIPGALGARFAGGPVSSLSLRGAANFVFRNGEVIDRVIQTSAGPVRFVAEVEVSGSQVILKDILVYPTEAGSRISVGVRELLQAAKPLLEEARQAGYKSIRFIGDRSIAPGSANPGRAVDFTRTLQ